MSLLADHNLPFAIALGLMLLLAVLQVVGVGELGADGDFDADASGAAGFMGGLTTLLGIGKVPFFVWLVVLLFLFAAVGVSVQSLAEGLTGAPLYSWLAALFAIGASLPLTSILVRPLAKVLPQDETTAVGLDTLVGRRGRISTGRSARGFPARTKVYDHHGQPHYVMVEPHEDTGEMVEGDDVLLVRREGQTFYGVPLAHGQLSPMK